jgi:hypothetical protein
MYLIGVLNCINTTDIIEILNNAYFRLEENEANNTKRLLEAIGEQKEKPEKIVRVKGKHCRSRVMAVVQRYTCM